MVNAPTGVVAGNVLVSCLALNGGGVSASGIPTGWLPIASVTSITNPRVFGYYKLAGASEPASYTWTLTSSGYANSAGIARYSGVSATSPLDGPASSAASATTSTSAILPGVTTSVANTKLIGCMAANASALVITPPSGMTEAWNLAGKRQEFADQTLAAIGASGTRTWTFGSARAWAGWLVALRPAPAAPAITSVNATTFTAGTPGSFTVTSSGSPTPTLSLSGPLPSGVTFTNNGNGTASLAGTPAVSGSYPVTLSAANGVAPNASQSFSLTVNPAPAAPAITSVNATTFTTGSSGSFTVTTAGSPTPTLSLSGTLPTGVLFTDNGDGTAGLAGTADRQRQLPADPDRRQWGGPQRQPELHPDRQRGTHHHQRQQHHLPQRQPRQLHRHQHRFADADPQPDQRHAADRGDLHQQRQWHRQPGRHRRPPAAATRSPSAPPMAC